MVWLGHYNYRKQGSVNATAAGAQTNYQKKLLVGETSGASGENVDCESHCQAFPNDIRFTGADKRTKHNYWVESITGTTPNRLATIWIKVATIPAAGAVDFYMYYGKAADAGESDIDDTFLFYDDFEDGDTTNIGDLFVTSVNRASATYARSGTYSMKLPEVHESSQSMSALTLNSVMVEMWLRIRDTTTRIHTITIYDSGGVAVTDQGALLKLDAGKVYSYNGTTWIDTGLSYSSSGVWKKLSILQGATTHDITFDGSTATGFSNRNTIANVNKVAPGRNLFDGDAYVDTFTIRKYAAPEPTWGTWGGETTVVGRTSCYAFIIG